MFIETEQTPNPMTLMFRPGQKVTGAGQQAGGGTGLHHRRGVTASPASDRRFSLEQAGTQLHQAHAANKRCHEQAVGTQHPANAGQRGGQIVHRGERPGRNNQIKAGIGKGQLILIADHNAGLIGGERHPLCAWPDCPWPAKIEHICKRPRHHRRAFAQFFGHQIMQEGYAAKT